MTRKNGKELVNKIKLKDGEQWYTKEELDLLESLGIECYEIQWEKFFGSKKKER